MILLLAKLAKLAPYVPLAIEAVRGVVSVLVEQNKAKRAEEERKKAEVEAISKPPDHAVQSKKPIER